MQAKARDSGIESQCPRNCVKCEKKQTGVCVRAGKKVMHDHVIVGKDEL